MIEEATKAMNNTEDSGLFDSNTLQRLEKSNEIIPYICSILKGIKYFFNEKSYRRRLICFQKSIFILKNGNFSTEQGKIILDR